MKQKFIVAVALLFGCTAAFAQKSAKKQAEPFIPAETTIFAMDLTNDTIGAVPTNWTIPSEGTCTVTELNGEKALKIEGEMTQVVPNMAENLPDAFTVEYEVWSDDQCPDVPFHNVNIEFTNASGDNIIMLYGMNPCAGPDHSELNYEFKKPNGAQGASAIEQSSFPMIKVNTWTKFQVSYKNGTFTYYINDQPMVRPTQTMKPVKVRLNGIDNEETGFYIRSFRVAK